MTDPPIRSAFPLSALVVDDDPDMCWVLDVTLRLCGYSVTIAHSGHEALGLADQGTFPLAFIDVRLPDMDGLHLATKLAQQQGKMKIVIISGYYSQDDPSIVEVVRAMRVHGFLAKPFQIEAIEDYAAADGSIAEKGGVRRADHRSGLQTHDC